VQIVATPAELDARKGWWGGDDGNSGSWEKGERAAERWLRPAGYVVEEVKRQLRRSKADSKVKAKLPAPTLASESRRLAGAVVEGIGFYAKGPRAAEKYVEVRRVELGLGL
jgi:hypothetical protein